MDRLNRALFTVLAVLLVAAGVAGTLASLGRLPRVDPATHLLPHALRDRWHDWGPAAWLVLAGAGLVVAVLGFLLVRGQLVPRLGRPMPDLVLTDPERADTPPGRTRVRSTALVHGFERDLARHPKVRRVSVGLGGDAADPLVHARLELFSGADVTHLQSYVAESLSRFVTTTGLDPADVRVVLALTDRDHHRVR
ncbi:hypothetical protein [Actinocatenispora rupis]|uniref:Alkaline shock response membrane anchor protein AmaP n=1 Tax=Actinocatenispora rupis TaxID=519421 RepID=A0A8J3J4L4_9ACTN|nr:hypothetical protein [Actinocatenispora rupis]GID11867.1 hypothetical protein Aru02nite_27560 [Actinocatenispora rupis]